MILGVWRGEPHLPTAHFQFAYDLGSPFAYERVL